jgi:hypothetical protein
MRLAVIQMNGSPEIPLAGTESLVGLDLTRWQLLFTTEDRPFAPDPQPHYRIPSWRTDGPIRTSIGGSAVDWPRLRLSRSLDERLTRTIPNQPSTAATE